MSYIEWVMINPVLNSLLKILARPEIVFFTMPVLMIVLIIGTLAQTEIGAYDAQEIYFSSLWFWAELGFIQIPMPGGGFLVALLAVNLFVKFVFFSRWAWNKSGIHLTHLGALILLIGGIVTALTSREYYMVIPEGVSTPYIYDYHQTETAIFKDSARITQDDLPFGFDIIAACTNCEIKRRTESDQNFADRPLQDMAQFMALHPKPSEKNSETNLSGLTIEISGLEGDQNGIYLAFQGMPKPIALTHDGAEYQIIHGKTQTTLPFEIRLDEFHHIRHGGVSLAKSFASNITVSDQGSTWPHKIEMNKPLRHRGLTFYQSSFDETPDGNITIFSVVENKGRIFPYIGTGIIGAGLILHILIMMGLSIKGRKE